MSLDGLDGLDGLIERFIRFLNNRKSRRYLHPPRLRVHLGAMAGHSDTKIWLDGQEITKLVKGIRIEAVAGHLTKVHLEILAAEINGTPEVNVIRRHLKTMPPPDAGIPEQASPVEAQPRVVDPKTKMERERRLGGI